jgi:hypothetical protein
MKQVYIFRLFNLLLFFNSFFSNAQKNSQEPTKLLRIYEDNDILNTGGNATDEAYTNGTRIDFFYTKKKRSKFIADRILPKAGDSSINVFSWGLTQLMFTPRDIASTAYQPNDYQYAGALFVTHTLYSYNPVKKYSIQSEIMMGVRGPAAFAGQTQTFIHGLIAYQKPMGWQYQLKNKPILNFNIAYEKQLLSIGSMVQITGGSELLMGTLSNSFALYPTIRIGKMNPYFNGYISQYAASPKQKNKVQAWFFVKPGVLFSATNSLLVSGTEKRAAKNEEADYSRERIANSVYVLNGGAVLTISSFSISFTQTYTTAMIKNLYSHQVGNISLYFAW